MSYDKYDGVTLGNQIGHEFEYDAFNPQLRKRINFTKSLKSDNVIGAINGLQNMIDYEMNIEKNTLKQPKAKNDNVKVINQKELVSDIQKEIEENRQKITLTQDGKNIADHQRITVTTNDERERA